MANKLKDMEVDSVDLCRRGANQRAFIKLLKSAGEEGADEGQSMSVIAKLADALQKALSGGDPEPITKSVGAAQVRETTESLRKSLESIIADDSLSPVEKHDMMAESLQQFTLEATDLMDGWAEAVWKADDEDLEEDDLEEDPEEEEPEEEEPEEEEPEEDENLKKGVFDMATIDIDKMSPEDKATLDALAKKYGGEEEVHPDVQKAIDEVAELRKSLEIKELEGISKKYEIIGKKPEELAPKLYELKKSGEQNYNDFVALLDEQVQMAESGIFKEIGTSRGGGASDLEATVAEIRKNNPNLTYSQAVVKAYETNPNLDRFTGKCK